MDSVDITDLILDILPSDFILDIPASDLMLDIPASLKTPRTLKKRKQDAALLCKAQVKLKLDSEF